MLPSDHGCDRIDGPDANDTASLLECLDVLFKHGQQLVEKARKTCSLPCDYSNHVAGVRIEQRPPRVALINTRVKLNDVRSATAKEGRNNSLMACQIPVFKWES